MSRVLGEIKKQSAILAAAIAMIGTSCYAADISLSEIEFTPSGNDYNIVLKTDKKTTFKKTIQSDEKILIELKNTATTEDFSTVYNDVSSINNITVTPSGKDDLKIQIQGSDVSKSNISIDYKNTPVAVKSQNFDESEINLSLPMENYKPIYDEQTIEEEESNSNLQSTLSKLNPITVAQSLTNGEESENDQNSNNFKWLTYIGLLIIMISAGKNIFKPAKETTIGLTQSLKEREKALAQKLNSNVRETLSLRNKIAQNASAPSINYGLRSYQNSQKNPYADAPATIRPIKRTLDEQANIKMSGLKTQPKSQTITTSIPKRNTYSTPLRQNKSINVDSMKFLESMTKIYEKNGRADLAMGLKNNINKVNI